MYHCTPQKNPITPKSSLGSLHCRQFPSSKTPGNGLFCHHRGVFSGMSYKWGQIARSSGLGLLSLGTTRVGVLVCPQLSARHCREHAAERTSPSLFVSQGPKDIVSFLFCRIMNVAATNIVCVQVFT